MIVCQEDWNHCQRSTLKLYRLVVMMLKAKWCQYESPWKYSLIDDAIFGG